MGEQVGAGLGGRLGYVSRSEIERVLSASLPATVSASLCATLTRINALYMIARAGSGHIGSSFSSLDILSWLHLQEMRDGEDLFFSSKGHDAPGYYALMIGLGRLQFELIHQLRRYGGLPGHPDISVPVCLTNTGTLGTGISKAKGMAFARRLQGKRGRIFVLTGDGELQEGQIWESLVSAANHRMHELVVIVDHNKLQSDTFLTNTSDLGDLEAKFAAFGWQVARCDGHDHEAMRDVFAGFAKDTIRPKVLIADTVKGRGVSFMEHTSLDSDVAMYRFHSGAPDALSYDKALVELGATANQILLAHGLTEVQLETSDAPQRPQAGPSAQRLVPAYSTALLDEARRNDKIVALDADLILDTGLIPFKEEFPERFVECGIAEQDMVSQAGGMALNALLPVVHSLACFLSARPNEQIYNNATEHTRIVYVGSLAGVLPAGPGHSHQAVRDIASMNGIPGLDVIEPCCAAEVPLLLGHALNDAPGSSYLRLVSIPCEIPYTLPADYVIKRGQGCVLRDGSDAVVIGYGPILLPEAFKAAEVLAARGISIRIVNLPWLNTVDANWLKEVIGDTRKVLTLDNHYLRGGQGEMIGAAVAALGLSLEVNRIGLDRVPASGGNAEIVAAMGLDAAAIVKALG